MHQGPLPAPDEEPPPDDEEPLTPEEEAAYRSWWAQLPDFIMPSYPFDVPPDRMLYARRVFTEFDVPRTCRVGACRRTGQCQGGDGPPCYRARPKELRALLFEGWINIYYPELCGEDEAASPSA
jgi:hypothetical protein